MIMNPAIKLRHIRAFLDIAALGSLTVAARAQGITQPALSRCLAELETLLGQPLFLRQGRRLVLTEGGTLFRRHASLAMQSLDTAASVLRQDGPNAVLTIGVLPTAATRLLPQVALRFRMVAPEVTLSVVTGPHAYLMGLLRHGEVEVMVGRMPAAAEIAGLNFEHLYEESVVLAARAGHPMAKAKTPEALRQSPLILPPKGAIIRRVVEDYLAAQGLAGLRPAFETVALSVGRGIVLGSDALWFISRGVIADELDRGEMIALPAEARFLSGAVGVTRRQAAAPQQGADLLMQLLREAATRL